MSDQLSSTQVSVSKPVRTLYAVAAGATAVSAGLPMLTPDRFDWIGPALGLLGIVITVAMGKYTEGSVTPWEDVAAKQTPSGRIIAGPAAHQPTGSAVVDKTDTVTPKFEPGGSVYNEPMEGDPL